MTIVDFDFSLFISVCFVRIDCKFIESSLKAQPINVSKNDESRIIGGDVAMLGDFKGVVSGIFVVVFGNFVLIY